MKILIVDDERNVLRDFVSEAEHIDGIEEIISFDDPRAALQYVTDGGAVDLAFLDINMPEIDGIELMKQLRTLRPELFITFLTAYSSYALGSQKGDKQLRTQRAQLFHQLDPIDLRHIDI